MILMGQQSTINMVEGDRAEFTIESPESVDRIPICADP